MNVERVQVGNGWRVSVHRTPAERRKRLEDRRREVKAAAERAQLTPGQWETIRRA